MSKGDWEVYEDADDRRTETTVTEKTACELYGHSYETVVDDEGEPILIGNDFVRQCNDCGNSYSYDPDEEAENPDGRR